mmetsp:Transcript_30046/g.67781  ORF Transcript_30046/g.67781 Transcript_30046/m.67781 type:complete len:180 (-) Transcript_30046:332-871(-)
MVTSELILSTGAGVHRTVSRVVLGLLPEEKADSTLDMAQSSKKLWLISEMDVDLDLLRTEAGGGVPRRLILGGSGGSSASSDTLSSRPTSTCAGGHQEALEATLYSSREGEHGLLSGSRDINVLPNDDSLFSSAALTECRRVDDSSQACSRSRESGDDDRSRVVDFPSQEDLVSRVSKL